MIQEHIKKPLADEILFGKLAKGGHVQAVLRDGVWSKGGPRTRRPGHRAQLRMLEAAE